jgi:hypothetical protein
MHLTLSLDPADLLVVHLREADVTADVAVRPSSAGARSLVRALEDAMAHGYGECFWPGSPGGQYWWIFKRDADTLETIAMWTRGGASLWEHVFRATDAATWVHERVTGELRRLGVDLDLSPPARS